MKLKGIGRLAGGVIAVSLIAAGCGSSDDDSGSSGDGGLEVVLSEWVVEPSASSIDAGEVTITAKNDGGENHELVIVLADSADDLPIDETGKILEDELPEGTFIGEIEEFEAGTEESGTFDLEAGTYILFCNLVEEQDDGSFESHFLEGMNTVLEVG